MTRTEGFFDTLKQEFFYGRTRYFEADGRMALMTLAKHMRREGVLVPVIMGQHLLATRILLQPQSSLPCGGNRSTSREGASLILYGPPIPGREVQVIGRARSNMQGVLGVNE